MHTPPTPRSHAPACCFDSDRARRWLPRIKPVCLKISLPDIASAGERDFGCRELAVERGEETRRAFGDVNLEHIRRERQPCLRTRAVTGKCEIETSSAGSVEQGRVRDRQARERIQSDRWFGCLSCCWGSDALVRGVMMSLVAMIECNC